MDDSLLTEHVLNLIPREEVPEVKPPRYRSQFYQMSKQEYQQGRHCHKTMGEERATVHTPHSFLKAHERSKSFECQPKCSGERPKQSDQQKPAVPRRDDLPVLGLKSNKDFVKQNVVDAKMQVAKKPAKKFVDTRNGTTHPLEPSGLQPLFLKKREFGAVPEYLSRRNAEMTAAQEEYDAYVAEMYRKGQMKQLTEMERAEILAGLKANWAELNKSYQSLSVTIDTVPKIIRKGKIEADLKDLEREIDLIERHKVIYVAN